MGLCMGTNSGGSNVSAEDQARNREIERQLQKGRKDEAKEVKILLLGAGDSGKSTFAKQMRILHCQGFADQERVSLTFDLVLHNTIIPFIILMYESKKYWNLPHNRPNNELFPDRELLLNAATHHEVELKGLKGFTGSLAALPVFSSIVAYSPSAKKEASAASSSGAAADGPDNTGKFAHVRSDGPKAPEPSAEAEEGAEDAPAIPIPDSVTLEQIGEAIEKLWGSTEVRQLFDRKKSELQLPDSSSYFWANAKRVCNGSFEPQQDDVLRMRVMTTGVQETLFDLEGRRFRIVDVGGQRSERRKWIHCFTRVNAVLFFASLSEYDQTLFESRKVNRMHESLRLFEETCNCQYFNALDVVLFLNKKDLFAEKLKYTTPSVAFSDYDAGDDYEKAVNFISDKFRAVAKRKVFVHQTCATDTENIRYVFKVVRESIINKRLAESGFS